MVKHRGILTIVGAIALSAVSVAVGMQVHSWLYGLADPATADREELLRWLVVADLAEHDDATCRVLVDRFESQFAGESDDKSADDAELVADVSSLSAEQRDRVAANSERLKDVWFHDRVQQYLALPADARAAFMDGQIRNIFRCAEIHRQMHGDNTVGSSADDTGAFVGDFFESLARWQAHAPAEKRDEISGVVKDGLIRWLATTDLSAQPPTARRQVVAGLEKELGEKLTFGDSTALLSATESQRFWSNVDVLAEAWFHAKAGEFVVVASAERGAFVARQLAVVGELAAHLPSTSQNSASTSVAAETAQRLQRWIASTNEQDRRAAQDFAAALQSAWIARALGISP